MHQRLARRCTWVRGFANSQTRGSQLLDGVLVMVAALTA